MTKQGQGQDPDRTPPTSARAERLPTLSDVARRAAVSLSTASRALSDSRAVDPRLKKRVLAAAKELGYVPNAHAQALARATSTTVGVIVHDISDPYFAAVARGAIGVASSRGLLSVICVTQRDIERELHYVSSLRAQRVRGIILTASGFRDPAYAKAVSEEARSLREAGGRLVAISRHDTDVDTVIPDNFGGGEAMGRLLVSLGHRSIGVITGPQQLLTVEDRAGGFRTALADAGVELLPHCIVEGGFSREGGYRAAERLLEVEPGLTAVFALNDLMAVGALAAFHDRGVRVPDDISLAGFDDIEVLRDVRPSLTTVRVPMEDLGRRAMSLALEAGERSVPVMERLPAEVVVRESTGAPRRGGSPLHRSVARAEPSGGRT